MTTATERADRASVDKFAMRRRMLAESALAAIAERGYAQTGLRDVAQHSELSHGSLHYYFDGKDDLVALAVWNYKSACARRYDTIVESSVTSDELAARFGVEMASTLRDEASLHRLWYDLRNQALFSEGFRDTIVAIDELLEEMVWAIVVKFAQLEGRPPAVTPPIAYALFDGLFRNTLIRFLRGEVNAVEELRQQAPVLLRTTLHAAD
ncbi:TetR/AcrR family transcriptional regulator [Microbacterium ulmi]|uniref:TetR/AcrR family transcriptional regulator n=1 Tax=Microbacterium ulmi TaxID=179095 RepID=A0A7Y2LZ17_9MICO|nr:TetR/AcrR family transcriptional regulator [Microbacterium ulmi]NII69641.1 AcrR family transcriptional regulator [Microbacterium ulmi]NNH03471.1 TetR/AcrR family transcriptional regulator [Microbacterium ulmi]